jgi:hypothetical protein
LLGQVATPLPLRQPAGVLADDARIGWMTVSLAVVAFLAGSPSVVAVYVAALGASARGLARLRAPVRWVT